MILKVDISQNEYLLPIKTSLKNRNTGSDIYKIVLKKKRSTLNFFSSLVIKKSFSYFAHHISANCVHSF